MENIKMKNLLGSLLNVLNPRIAEFNDLMTIRADQMVMLLVTIRFLILRQVLSKLMLTHQIALHQQIKGVVHRGPADPVVLVLHADIQRLHIKMTIPGINFLQDSVSLGRLPQRLVFQVRRKDLPDFLVYGWTVDHEKTN